MTFYVLPAHPCFAAPYVTAEQQRGETNALPYYLKTAYAVGGGIFGQYFCKTYGEPAFIEGMLYPDRTPALTGTTLDAIVDDWALWVMQGAS